MLLTRSAFGLCGCSQAIHSWLLLVFCWVEGREGRLYGGPLADFSLSYFPIPYIKPFCKLGEVIKSPFRKLVFMNVETQMIRTVKRFLLCGEIIVWEHDFPFPTQSCFLAAVFWSSVWVVFSQFGLMFLLFGRWCAFNGFLFIYLFIYVWLTFHRPWQTMVEGQPA